jgi:hypothetical protein
MFEIKYKLALSPDLSNCPPISQRTRFLGCSRQGGGNFKTREA